MPTVAPYGSWKSPLTSDLIVAGTIGLEQVVVDDNDLYWIEARPAEEGRNVIVRQSADGNIQDITPASFNARTRVHEYGGGAYTGPRRHRLFQQLRRSPALPAQGR
jgi:hypothetical protein